MTHAFVQSIDTSQTPSRGWAMSKCSSAAV